MGVKKIDGVAHGKSVARMKADYLQWIGELKKRYKAMQCKAAVAVNSALIEFPTSCWRIG